MIWNADTIMQKIKVISRLRFSLENTSAGSGQTLSPSSKSARLGRPILKGLAEMDSDDRRCRWAKLKLGLLHE